MSRANIIILSGIMGLDLSDPSTALFVSQTIVGIEDIDTFIEYCRDKKDGIEYSTKTEKLDTLATKYKKLQKDAKLPHDTARSFSKTLVDKVNTARPTIKNLIEQGVMRPFSSLILHGDKYFTDKEIKALGGIGSSSLIIEYYEQNILEDKLISLFLSKYISKAKYESLADGQRKIQKMIGAPK